MHVSKQFFPNVQPWPIGVQEISNGMKITISYEHYKILNGLEGAYIKNGDKTLLLSPGDWVHYWEDGTISVSKGSDSGSHPDQKQR